MKLSSYQKLKRENERLKRNLRTVILNPKSLEALGIHQSIHLENQIEQSVFHGNCENELSFNGILAYIK